MLILAPLQGYTDFVFRNVYNRYYSGIDLALSPFISMMHGKKGYPLVAKDVNPEYNKSMPLIPQLLGNNPDYFIQMAKFLDKWGYKKLNWNLGCPVKNVTFKKKGSGLLPYPEMIREILEKTIPNIPQKLSLKIRLGLLDKNEIYKLIPVLNDFPLENITIHPRIAIQMYEGDIHHDMMDECISLIKHKIIYNGDICTLADYNSIKKRYPTINSWMIGRGVIVNPLLPAIIKGEPTLSDEENKTRFKLFILDLYKELQIYRNNHQTINKIKDYWRFFSLMFSDPQSVYEQITHAGNIDEIIYITEKLFAEKSLKQLNQ